MPSLFDLSPQELRAWAILAYKPGEVVTYSRLSKFVNIHERTLGYLYRGKFVPKCKVVVHQLRKKGILIGTIRGTGNYLL